MKLILQNLRELIYYEVLILAKHGQLFLISKSLIYFQVSSWQTEWVHIGFFQDRPLGQQLDPDWAGGEPFHHWGRRPEVQENRQAEERINFLTSIKVTRPLDPRTRVCQESLAMPPSGRG